MPKVVLKIQAILLIALVGCSVEESIDTGYAKDSISTCTPLLASRFSSLPDLKSKVQITYEAIGTHSQVTLKYKDKNSVVNGILVQGLSELDLSQAKDGDLWDKLKLVYKTPFGIRKREEMNKVYFLARRRPFHYGEGDVAFYDLALSSVSMINTPELAYRTRRDSSEKGYINTFNHITAQAFITSLYGEELADFIADLHEKKNMPELCTGEFSPDQLNDTLNYPVDNYVDIANNEIGQELGKSIGSKLSIDFKTVWTTELTTSYLNELHKFYTKSMHIGFSHYNPEDELIIRFTDKINKVQKGYAQAKF